MGRNRIPTVLKIAAGNRGKRPLNRLEPIPSALRDLDPPEWLPREAAEVWREVTPHLDKAGVLTSADVDACCMVCVSVALYRRAAVEALSSPIATGIKADYLSPWMLVKSMAFKQAIVALREFGMTPAARSRVMARPRDETGYEKTDSYFD